MKHLSYYTDIQIPYPLERDFYALKLNKINNQRMTATERETAISEIPNLFAKEIKKNTNQYKELRDEKLKEFWNDCRSHVGYDKILSHKGCELLEKEAWSRYRKLGLEDVFEYLCDLGQLILSLKDEIS